ncbi:hypothetical protein [Paraburkholderia sp. BCC1886]|uniref:hypothetical protein n=1 Tax=Paraburkholderia sp. BCC1886 TaxID=2562670 RepID=UPI0011830FAE|nr:hypothetical protein [Paraburkholderia sp. BCC1886]
MRNLVFVLVTTAAAVTASSVPCSVSAQTDRDFYRQRNTTLPRAISSDPMTLPFATQRMDTGTALGSTVNMSREARRDYNARMQTESDERDKQLEARRDPPLKFNMPKPEMPKPNAVD